jgi:hypothetical protein
LELTLTLEEQHRKMKAEIYKPRNTKDGSKPSKGRERAAPDSLFSPSGRPALLTH